MTDAEKLVRAAWEFYTVWEFSKGIGDPPPLIVSPQQYEDFKAAGLPEYMMRIDQPLPTKSL